MTQDRKLISGLELNELTTKHEKWLQDKTKGKQLDVSNINFRPNFKYFMSHRNFTNSICRNSIFPEECLVPFKNCDLTDSSFEGSELKNQSFEESDLTNVNFEGADIRGCNFTNAILKNVITDANTKMDDNFRNALKLYKEKADKEKADKEKTDKEKADKEKIENSKLQLEHSEIKISEYSVRTIQHELWLKSSGKEGKQLDFSNIDFIKSGFRTFGYTKNIENSICRNVIFPQEVYSSFENVDLSNSVFENCKRLPLSFANSNLTGVNFKGVDLRGIVFTNTILQDVIIDDKTQVDINFLNALAAFKNSEKEQSEIKQNKKAAEKEPTEKNIIEKENLTLPERNNNFKCDNAYETLITNHFEWLEDNTKGKQLDLSNIDFKASDFISVGYTRGVFKNAIIKNSVFPGVLHCDLEHSDLSNSIFTGCRLNNHSFKNSNLTNVDFRGTDLRGCNFENTILDNIKINNSTKFDSNFTDAIIHNHTIKLNANNLIRQISESSEQNKILIENSIKKYAVIITTQVSKPEIPQIETPHAATSLPRQSQTTPTTPATPITQQPMPEIEPEIKYVSISDGKLDIVYSKHLQWLNSNKNEGNQLDVSNVNFKLTKDVLSRNFTSAICNNTIFPATCNVTFEDASLVNANFKNSNLKCSSFRGSNLTGADFSNANIRGCDFSGAIIKNIKYNSYTLMDDDFRKRLIFENSQKELPTKESINKEPIKMEQSGLSAPILDKAEKEHILWLSDNSKGKQLDLSNLDFKSARFTHIGSSRILRNIVAKNTTFPEKIPTNLENSNLEGSKFVQCKLINTSFKDCNLKNVDFSGADIRDCNFENAILDGIKIDDSTIASPEFWRKLVRNQSKDLENLKQDNKTLEKINKDLEHEKEELEEKLGELEEEKKQLESDKERLEEEKSELENDKEVLEREKEELEEEKESLEEEKSELENEKENLDEQKSELENEKASLEEEKSDLEEKNGELENEKESLEEKNNELEEKLEKISSIRWELESTKEVLETQVADLGFKIVQLEYSFKELQETNEDLQKKALELPVKTNTLKKILNSQQANQFRQNGQQALNTAFGNKCSEIIYKNTKLILATKIPKNVLNNPLIDSLIKICAPHLLLQASKSLPNFKNLDKIQKSLESACIGSVSNVSSDTIEHIMDAFLPIIKQLSSPSILKEIAGSEE